jgi:F0F1-type ATP synthase delta subunit
MPGMPGFFAKVVYTVGEHLNDQEALESDLQQFVSAIRQRQEVRGRFLSNDVSEPQLKYLTDGLKMGETSSTFLRWVRDNKMLHKLDDIVTSYGKLRSEATGVVRGTVTTGTPVSAQVLENLKQFLTKRHLKAGQTLQLDVSIDPEQGPGISYEVGNVAVDDTLNTKLKQLMDAYTTQITNYYDNRINTLQSTDFRLPPSEEELKARALFDPRNAGFDFSRIPDAPVDGTPFDWDTVPDVRK